MKLIAKLIFAVTLIIAFYSCSDNTIKVACVGDSITEGYGIKIQSKSSYPVLLGMALGDNYSVLNLGRSATNAQQSADFPYWIAKEFSNVFAYQPNIIVIKLGTNDTKPGNWNQENYKRDYQALIDTFKTIASNPKIYICKPVPVYQTKWGINDSIVNHGVIPVLEQLASGNSIDIIDLNAPLSDKPELFPDFIHPNEEGVKIIADIVAKSILEKRQ